MMGVIGKTRRLVGRFAIDPDSQRGDSGEPETWSTKSRWGKMKHFVKVYRLAIFGLTLIAGGFALYLQSYFPPAQNNPFAVYITSLLGVYLIGKLRGREEVREILQTEIDIHADFRPSMDAGGVIRYGKLYASDQGSLMFNRIKNISFGFYDYAFEMLTDTFPRNQVKNHKNKYERAKSDEPTNYRLDGFLTEDVRSNDDDVALHRNAVITHSGGTVDDLSSQESDKQLVPPQEMDKSLSLAVRQELEAQDDEIKFLGRKVDQALESNQTLKNKATEQEREQLETIERVLQIFQSALPQNSASNNSESDVSLESTLGDNNED